ncbi:hypothetical protein PT277_05365 [Acetobacteraceae bacterium ESL0709]|nr:hypothetical protein [Acetobacteraceae bacterium ESL0697]MDF7678125.1 hypothetical protein [Acetobacteraceae bacterium ESL0709]
MTQDEVARFMADGIFTSPSWFLNGCLFAMRISGTNFAIREGPDGKTDELAFRDPALWTSQRMLEAANGLPVIMQHPETASLTDRSFAEQIVGTVIYPFVRQNELWGIARILNRPLAEELAHHQWSTSPGVITGRVSGISLRKNGGFFNYENMPFLLDHLAICEQGVWDKGQAPSGIDIDAGLFGNGADYMDDEIDPIADQVISPHHNPDEGVQVKHDDMDDAALVAALDKMTGLKELMASLTKDGKGISDIDLASLARKLFSVLGGLDKDRKEPDHNPSDDKNSDTERLKQLNDEIEALRQRTTPLSDDENNEISEITAKADAVAVATGTIVPRHIAGETPMAFRRRLAKQFLQFSRTQRGADLSTLSDQNFEIAERQIYADALHYQPAQSSLKPTDPMIRKTMTDPITGQRITRYQGSPRAAFAPFLATPLGS